MKLVIELDITSDIIEDFDDVADRMEWLMQHFDYCWRNDIGLSTGAEGVISDKDGNETGKWEIVA